jgi:hypothetical protein
VLHTAATLVSMANTSGGGGGGGGAVTTAPLSLIKLRIK